MYLQASSSLLSHRFIDHLTKTALHSSAVNHRYLDLLAAGGDRQFEKVISDFALQYGFYSDRFVHYVLAVIANLDDKVHQRILQGNLDEEYGNTHDVMLPEDVMDSIVGQPHTLLFKRFQRATGITEEMLGSIRPDSPGILWANKFEALCKENALAGIGALGFGTEFIVSSIYQKILCGIKMAGFLAPTDHVFFDLHAECDDEHAQQFVHIASDLLVDSEAESQIEYGMAQALKLRSEFWDQMLERV